MTFSYILIGFLVAIAVYWARYGRATARLPKDSRMPPGPKGIPILGNMLQIPNYHSWLQFKAWSDLYGPVFRFTIMGRNHVVVSTEKIANDLLRERGNIYSSREQLPMAAALVSDNLRPLFLPYDDLWRRGRKLMHVLTMTSAATSYQPTQMLESTRMILDLIREPAKYEIWFERYAAGIIMRLGFGKTIETGEEPHVRQILGIVHTIERVASPGAYLVDTFSWLLYLPEWFAPFKREGRQLHQDELILFRRLQDDVRQELKKGISVPCFTSTFLARQDEFGLSDDEGAYVIGTLFEAGSGTTAAAKMSFCLAMCHYPEWQDQMQAEIDRFVPEDRMPDFDDILNLPTVRAVIKEVLRWRPVTAGGVPHQLIRDDHYEGLFFSKGTNIHPNQWAIHRDPNLYPDPETFNPNRWLKPDYPTYREPLSKHPNLQNFSAFGFGRRICPGMNIAERSLHLLVARVAWACTINKKGEILWYDYTTGFNVQPRHLILI